MCFIIIIIVIKILEKKTKQKAAEHCVMVKQTQKKLKRMRHLYQVVCLIATHWINPYRSVV